MLIKNRDSKGRFARRDWLRNNVAGVVFFSSLLIPTFIGATAQWIRGGMEPVVYTAEAYEVEVEVEEKTVLIRSTADVVEYTDLQKIADCESGVRNADGTAVPFSGKQRDEYGNVIKGQYTFIGEDIGKWQINTFFHLERARSFGIDIYTEEGNERFAKILFHEAKGQPWSASRNCHGVQ